MATSMAFLQGMQFSEVQRFTGWTREAVFLKHYKKSLSSVKVACVALAPRPPFPTGPDLS